MATSLAMTPFERALLQLLSLAGDKDDDDKEAGDDTELLDQSDSVLGDDVDPRLRQALETVKELLVTRDRSAQQALKLEQLTEELELLKKCVVHGQVNGEGQVHRRVVDSSASSSMSTPQLCRWLLASPGGTSPPPPPDETCAPSCFQAVESDTMNLSSSSSSSSHQTTEDTTGQSNHRFPQSPGLCPNPALASQGPPRWRENKEVHPVPSFDMRSPVIIHLLNNWTDDNNKVSEIYM